MAEWKAELEQKKQRLATKPDQAEGLEKARTQRKLHQPCCQQDENKKSQKRRKNPLRWKRKVRRMKRRRTQRALPLIAEGFGGLKDSTWEELMKGIVGSLNANSQRLINMDTKSQTSGATYGGKPLSQTRRCGSLSGAI